MRDLFVYLIAALSAMAFMFCLVMLNGCTSVVKFDPKFIHKADCDSAAEHMRITGCIDLMLIPGPDEKYLTDDDLHWSGYCKAMQASQIIELDLGCVMSKNNCTDIEDCLND